MVWNWKKHLSRHFPWSSWDATVLMDEGDVFLETHGTADIERNAMVTLFLRRLEYFQDMLFLTMNRVKNLSGATIYCVRRRGNCGVHFRANPSQRGLVRPTSRPDKYGDLHLGN
ncbi:hypothetical protein DFH09DRAFT_923599 [Mycena vulgaris]|nr:hypothetical protein DFH09DRAFT_923599 [Mycena vulgaris]